MYACGARDALRNHVSGYVILSTHEYALETHAGSGRVDGEAGVIARRRVRSRNPISGYVNLFVHDYPCGTHAGGGRGDGEAGVVAGSSAGRRHVPGYVIPDQVT